MGKESPYTFSNIIIQPALYEHPINMDTFHGPLVSVSIRFDCNTFLLFSLPNPLAKYEFYHIKIDLFKASLSALDDYRKHNSNPT